MLAFLNGQPIKERVALQRWTGRITITLSQDNQGTAKPAIIDDRANQPALVGEVIISGDDEEWVVTKIAPGDLHGAITGTIPHQHGQLIEDRRGKGNPLDMEALLHGGYMEEELVSGYGHDEN